MEAERERPNILFIMADQWRHDWLGYRGADWVDTPNLDALAQRSRIFTQAICNSPVCAPSRIGLASGLYPHRLGALDNHAFLPLSQKTYYAQLRDHGYHVGCCGKLDLAKPDGFNGYRGDRPLTYAWGFTDPHECEGKMHAGRGDPPNGPYTHWLREQDPKAHKAFCEDYKRRVGRGAARLLAPSVVPTELFEDTYIAERSGEMIRSLPREFPWHFFVSFVGPHDPFDPPEEYFARYADRDMPGAIPRASEERGELYAKKAWRDLDEATINHARQLYAGAIAHLDEQIGKLLQVLEATGQADNTCIIFASDHGEMLGDHHMWTKAVPYEAALRVPLMISGPGIEAGTSEALVELNDINPTVCDLAGVPTLPGIDARSLRPLLHGETEMHRQVQFSAHRGFMLARTAREKAVIHDTGRGEYYRLDADPGEQRNLAETAAEAFARLRMEAVAAWRGVPQR